MFLTSFCGSGSEIIISGSEFRSTLISKNPNIENKNFLLSRAIYMWACKSPVKKYFLGNE